MGALVTQNFRIHNSKQFKEMFNETELFGGTSVTIAKSVKHTGLSFYW